MHRGLEHKPCPQGHRLGKTTYSACECSVSDHHQSLCPASCWPIGRRGRFACTRSARGACSAAGTPFAVGGEQQRLGVKPPNMPTGHPQCMTQQERSRAPLTPAYKALPTPAVEWTHEGGMLNKDE